MTCATHKFFPYSIVTLFDKASWLLHTPNYSTYTVLFDLQFFTYSFDIFIKLLIKIIIIEHAQHFQHAVVVLQSCELNVCRSLHGFVKSSQIRNCNVVIIVNIIASQCTNNYYCRCHLRLVHVTYITVAFTSYTPVICIEISCIHVVLLQVLHA